MARIATVYQTKTRVKRAGRYLTTRNIVHKIDDRGSMSKLEVAMPAAWTDDDAANVICQAMNHQDQAITVREGTL